VTERHLSPTDLDLLSLGDLGDLGPQATTTASLERHLQGCAACQERRQGRAARHADFRRDPMPRLLARLSTARTRRSRLRALFLTLAPAAAAALLLLFARLETNGTDTGGTSAVAPSAALGVKGAPGLRLVVRRGEAVFEVASGATLNAGDALRFVLEPVDRPYLLIASLDGQGKASIYHPFGGSSSARVTPGGMVEAPAGSVVLDTALGPERVFALWSSEPLRATDVLARLNELGQGGPEAIRATTTLDIPGTIQISRLFEKGDPP
jgi:hypothetical protein